MNSTWKTLRFVLTSAIPILINLEAIALIGIVDLELAGRLSPAAQAAVGLGDQLLYLTSTAAAGLSVATCAVAARYFGAGNHARLLATIKASLVVATICGALATLLGIFAADAFVRILSNDPEVIKYGARYIQLCAVGTLPYIMLIVIASIFRAIGRTAESLYLAVTTAIISIILSYLLFLSNLPVKHSLDALCLAWIIGAYAGLATGIIVLRKRLKDFQFAKKQTTRQEFRLTRVLVSIGIAVVLADSSTLMTDFLVYKMLSPLEDATNLQAAWTIFLKVEETFAIMPISAVALAFAATVGQMFGQGREQEVKRVLSTLVFGTTIVSATGGILLITAPQVMASFTHADLCVFSSAQTLLHLAPIFFPLLAVRLLMFSYMEGAGQTREPMLLAITGNALKLALGFTLLNMFSLGAAGLTIAILVSRIFLAAGSAVALFRTGRFEFPQPARANVFH